MTKNQIYNGKLILLLINLLLLVKLVSLLKCRRNTFTNFLIVNRKFLNFFKVVMTVKGGNSVKLTQLINLQNPKQIISYLQ